MKKKKTLRNMIVLSFLLGIGIVLCVISAKFKINSITVKGNIHYTDEQIIEHITSNGYVNNSFFLSLKNKIFKIEPVKTAFLPDAPKFSPTKNSFMPKSKKASK